MEASWPSLACSASAQCMHAQPTSQPALVLVPLACLDAQGHCCGHYDCRSDEASNHGEDLRACVRHPLAQWRPRALLLAHSHALPLVPCASLASWATPPPWPRAA